MKNTLKTLAAIIALTFATNTVLANDNRSNPTDFVVNGVIIKTNKSLDAKCKIELFYENQLVEETIIKLNKPFEYKLKKDVWYTIRVTKEGFLPLLISFNTEAGNEEILDNVFHFETELIELAEAKFLNPDLIDFPVGVVALNKETKKFEAREVYTNNYVAGLYEVPAPTYTHVTKVYTSITTQLPADIAKEYVSRDTELGSDMV